MAVCSLFPTEKLQPSAYTATLNLKYQMFGTVLVLLVPSVWFNLGSYVIRGKVQSQPENGEVASD